MLELSEATLERGSPVMMFPEGTRSPDGHMRAFKPGAFDLALRTGCPIQPILIQGSARALPKHGLVIRGRHRIRITVMQPLETGTFGERDAEALAQHVHDLMAAELDRLGGPSRLHTA
jgi:1-acyl-sn-glycerol-3-phosphate acyltransferase